MSSNIETPEGFATWSGTYRTPIAALIAAYNALGLAEDNEYTLIKDLSAQVEAARAHLRELREIARHSQPLNAAVDAAIKELARLIDALAACQKDCDTPGLPKQTLFVVRFNPTAGGEPDRLIVVAAVDEADALAQAQAAITDAGVFTIDSATVDPGGTDQRWIYTPVPKSTDL